MKARVQRGSKRKKKEKRGGGGGGGRKKERKKKRKKERKKKKERCSCTREPRTLLGELDLVRCVFLQLVVKAYHLKAVLTLKEKRRRRRRRRLFL